MLPDSILPTPEDDIARILRDYERRLSHLETLEGGAGGLYSAYINIRDEKSQNTSGGTFTLGAWRTRDLNVEAADTGGDATLAANQITLEAGTYRALISCPAYAVTGHQARLRDITNGATLLTGTVEFANPGDNGANRSFIEGRFTLAAETVLEVQHQGQSTQAGNGFGVAANFTTEVYTIVEFWKES